MPKISLMIAEQLSYIGVRYDGENFLRHGRVCTEVIDPHSPPDSSTSHYGVYRDGEFYFCIKCGIQISKHEIGLNEA